jgi:hypothetical protein
MIHESADSATTALTEEKTSEKLIHIAQGNMWQVQAAFAIGLWNLRISY